MSRFTDDVYKNSFFLWQYIGNHHIRYTWQRFFCQCPLHNNKYINVGFVETLEGGLGLQSAPVCLICSFRSDTGIWRGSLSPNVRPDHMWQQLSRNSKESDHQGVVNCRQYMYWHSNIHQIKKDSQIKSNGGFSVKMMHSSSLMN